MLNYLSPQALGDFLSGILMMSLLVIAIYFLRFFRQSGERLFAYFSAAFLTMALERLVLVFGNWDAEHSALVYVIRVLAFLIIIFAILDNNRTRRHKSQGFSGTPE